MFKTQEREATCKSRRDFAKIISLGVTGSALVRGSMADARPDDAQVDALVKLSTQSSAVRLTDTELADLKKDIQEGQKGLAKIRDFKVRADIEPAFVFRAK